VDPVWALVAELWWIGPAAVGAGGLGFAGVRLQRSTRRRHLELEAARHDARGAREALTRARAGVMAARAEVARAEADRTAGRAAADPSRARRMLQAAQQEVRAATANVRAQRAMVKAARAAVPPVGAKPDALPLARIRAAHDAVMARWMAYETDPALGIDHPEMSDPHWPPMAGYLRALSRANALRPASADTRLTPAEFAAYRDAVRAAERAFADAERAALGHPAPADGGATDAWMDRASEIADTAMRSAEAIARAAAAGWARRPRKSPPSD
jgi:hypothetical protein